MCGHRPSCEGKEAVWPRRQGLERHSRTSRNGIASSLNEWEEARKDRSLEPSEGARPCPHLGFRLPASRTVGEQTSVVLTHSVCGSFTLP